MKKAETTSHSNKAVKVVVIVQSPTDFKSTENYLIRRGIQVFVTNDAEEAFIILQEKTSDIAFISWNLTSSSPSKMLEVIQEKFNIQCIAFAEKGDFMTAASLSVSKAKNIIHAPMSGPVAHMKIQKILKKLEEGAESIWVKGNTQKKIHQEALRFILGTLVNEQEKLETRIAFTAKNLGVIEVSSKESQAYVLFGAPNDEVLPNSTVDNFKRNLDQSLNESKSALWTEQSYILHQDMDLFDEWLKERGVFTVEGSYLSQPMLVYYLERHFKKPRPTHSVEGMQGTHLDFIRVNETINFDAFIRLEKNKKFLKYFKKNSVVHPERIEKLKREQVNTIYISETEWPMFHRYEARTYLQSEYQNFRDQGPSATNV